MGFSVFNLNPKKATDHSMRRGTAPREVSPPHSCRNWLLNPIIVGTPQIATRQLLTAKVFLFGILLGFFVPLRCQAEEPLLFGQSAALSGPAAELGLGAQRGILSAFAEQNRIGGIRGRRLELISYDDGYQPERAIENTSRLLSEDHVFALIGEVGTPTSKAVEGLAERAGVPFIAPVTGAEFLRDPALDWVVNLRASYYQETEAMVQWLVSERSITRIAVLYQDDTFGRAGLTGVELALSKRDLAPVATGSYMRNTTAVKRALLEIRRGDPEAVIIIGAYKPAAAFIRWYHRLGMHPLFLSISFVGTKPLANELRGVGEKVFVTQVVPHPEDAGLPLVRRFQQALSDLDSAAVPEFVSFEGYIAGRLVIQVLARIQGRIDRESFMRTLKTTGPIDVDGFTLSYEKTPNQGSDAVYLTRITETGAIESVSRNQ
jgi:branched-chain amino acid transport system substrate-binding protein